MTQSRSIRIIFCTSMLSVLLSSTSMSSSAFMTTPSSPSFQQRNGILLYNNLNNEKFTQYAESNNRNNNDDNDNKKRSFTFFNSRKTQKLIKKSTKLILPALFFTLSPHHQTTTFIQPANAVLGKIPTRPKTSRPDADELAKERMRGQQNIMPLKPDFNNPKYQGEAGEKLKTLHMRMYQEQLNKYNEANNGEGSRISSSGLSQGGQKVDAIRPAAPLRPQTASSTASSIQGAEAINDVEGQETGSTDASSSTTNSESAASAQLQMLRQQQALASSSASSSSSSSSSISVQSVRKPASQKKISTTKQRSKQITSRLIKLSGFAAAGIAYGRFQNGKERRKVQKGIEIYNTQKAEFFNVTLDPDSDLSVDEQIKRAKSNSTDTDDDDDDYDMDDDPDEDDEPPTGRSNRGVSGGGKPPKKPSSGGSGSTGGSSSSSPSSPSTSSSSSSDENKKASDDDIERMKRLFDKD